MFITSDAQLLRFPAVGRPPAGPGGRRMAGIRLAAGAPVIWFGAVRPARPAPGGAAGTGGGDRGRGAGRPARDRRPRRSR